MSNKPKLYITFPSIYCEESKKLIKSILDDWKLNKDFVNFELGSVNILFQIDENIFNESSINATKDLFKEFYSLEDFNFEVTVARKLHLVDGLLPYSCLRYLSIEHIKDLEVSDNSYILSLDSDYLFGKGSILHLNKAINFLEKNKGCGYIQLNGCNKKPNGIFSHSHLGFSDRGQLIRSTLGNIFDEIKECYGAGEDDYVSVACLLRGYWTAIMTGCKIHTGRSKRVSDNNKSVNPNYDFTKLFNTNGTVLKHLGKVTGLDLKYKRYPKFVYLNERMVPLLLKSYYENQKDKNFELSDKRRLLEEI